MIVKKQKISPMEMRKMKTAYLFLLPNIIGFFVFMFIPIIMSLFISFTDWDGFGKMNFIGLKNYVKLFTNEGFIISFKNTMYFTLIFVPATLGLALLVAVALNTKVKGMKFYRTAYFLPYITSTIAVAVVWQLIYHPSLGPVNSFLKSIGMENPPQWLSSSKWAMTSVIISSVWKSVGYYTVIFLAGIQGISKELYEAAEVDGANFWHKFRSITIPMLSPIIFFSLIIAIINSFKVFDMVFTLTGGGPGRSTNVLVYSIYTEAFEKYNFGYSSAMAYVLLFIILIVTWIQFRGQKKWVNY